MLALKLFGELSATWEGQPVALPRRADVRRLFAYLALHPFREISRLELAFTLWPESTESQAKAKLRRAVHWLSRFLQDLDDSTDWLLRSRSQLGWIDEARFDTDVLEFERLLREAAEAEGIDALKKAVALQGDDLLSSLDDDWLKPERNRLRARQSAALERLGRALLAANEIEASVRFARQALAIQPLSESSTEILIRGLCSLDDPAEALSVYQRFRRELQASFGIEPGDILLRLGSAIERGEALPDRPDFGLEPWADKDAASEDSVQTRLRLPVPTVPLIGRRDELQAVRGLLEDSRLVTIRGTGGAGKTRLAIELAHELRERYPQGVAWVALENVLDEEVLPSTVADSLGLEVRGGKEPSRAIVDYLESRRQLIVFDNCEHVLEPTLRLVRTLLDSAPKLRVIATSRAKLDLPEEAAWQIPPLPVPVLENDTSDREILDSESVQLFIQRVSARWPSFETDRKTLREIASICHMVEGVPLAIELAAARIDTLTVEEISAQLEQALSVLRSRSRSLPERHLAMRSTIEWSVRLLSSEERRALAALGYFVGGFSAAAMRSVAQAVELEDEGADVLASLVDQSLVILDSDAANGPRYRMLEVIRQYGSELLDSYSVRDELALRHAEHYLELAESAAPRLRTAEASDWLDRLEAEIGNIRLALRWTLEADRIDLALRLVVSLRIFWVLRLHLLQERRWTEAVLERAQGREAASWIAAARRTLGSLAYQGGDYEGAKTAWGEAASEFQGIQQLDDASECLHLQALALTALSDYETARTSAEQAAQLARDIDAEQFLANALASLANLDAWQGNLEAARDAYQESLRLLRSVNAPPSSLTSVLRGLASVHHRLGQHAEADALLEEGHRICASMRDHLASANIRLLQGTHLTDQGRFDEAAAAYRSAMASYREHGHEYNRALALEWLGDLELRRDRPDLATMYLGQSLAWHRTAGPEWSMTHVLNKLAEARLESGRIDESLELAKEALEISRRRSLDDQRVRALRVLGLAKLRSQQEAQAGEALFEGAQAALTMEQSSHVLRVLDACVEMALSAGDRETAARLLGRIERNAEHAKGLRTMAEELRMTGWRHQLRSELGAQRFQTLLREGASMDASQVNESLQALRSSIT